MYTDLLIQLGRANLSFILKIEKNLEELVQGGLSTKFSFPPMDRIQRQIIHELAKHYNIETQSYDAEPLRNVVATRRKDSKL